MASPSVLELFDRLTVWSSGDQRAPHKPLLVLYALARWSRGDRAEIPFTQVNVDLTALLKEFGPPRRSNHPEYPFWRLQTDGVWVVRADGPLEPRQGNNDAKKSELLGKNARGGFTAAVRDAITADPTLVAAIAGRLLDSHFPASIHPDLLAAVGLDIAVPTAVCRAGRDPHF